MKWVQGEVKGLSYKSVMVFLCLQRKWRIALKKVCCQIAKKHGEGDTEKESSGYMGKWKVEFVKEFVTCILT